METELNQKYLDKNIRLANAALTAAKTKLARLAGLTWEDLRDIHSNLNRWVDFFNKAFTDGNILPSDCRRKNLDRLLNEMKQLRLSVKKRFVSLDAELVPA